MVILVIDQFRAGAERASFRSPEHRKGRVFFFVNKKEAKKTL
jgi:hypothetical protein